MRLSAKLLGFLNRAFEKDPAAFLALRLRYDGGMQWTVADGFLTTVVQGGSGAPLLVDLSAYTVRTLASFLAIQPGYSVPYVPNDPDQNAAAALRLVDGEGDIGDSNGDHLLAYTSILYAWIDSQAVELAAAEAAIQAMPDEMATTTANGSWVDYLGSYYGVPRNVGEADRLYGLRIIAEVLRPKSNNVAMEASISSYTGQAVSVTDVVIYRSPEPLFDGTTNFDGTRHFQAVTQPVYGLFDVQAGYDLLGGDAPAAFLATVRAIIEHLRAAGTQLRALALGGSALVDAVPPPTDPVDSLVVNHAHRFDGRYRFDGTINFVGSVRDVGTIESADSSGAVASTLETQVGTPDGILPIAVALPDGTTAAVAVAYDFLAV